MTIKLPINQHTDSLFRGLQVTWPAANNQTAMPSPNGGTVLPPVTANPGDLIVANRGQSTSYVSADGSVTLTFGASFTPATGAFVLAGFSSNSSALYPFSGPYLSISPTLFNAEDPGWGDLEPLGIIDANPGPDNTYPFLAFSGWQSITSGAVASGAILEVHFAPSHHAFGTLAGPTARASGTPTPLFTFVSPVAGDALEFLTHDGSGDVQNPIGGASGAYFVTGVSSTLPGSDFAYGSRGIIYATGGGTTPACAWPSPAARSIIAFCTLFPGSSTVPTVTGSGGTLAIGTYRVAYCYYKSVTLNCQSQSGSITSGGTIGTNVATLNNVTDLFAGMIVTLVKSGPNTKEETLVVSGISGTTVTFTGTIQYSGHLMATWGTYTQTIETPVSAPANVVVSVANSSAVLTIPPLPTGWDGYRIYCTPVNGSSPDYPFIQLTSGTNYSAAGVTNGVQITLTTAPASYAGTTPACGFSAWPSGTLLVKDPNAAQFDLMKWGHLSNSYDPNTGNWTMQTYNDAQAAANSHDLNLKAVQPLHANAVNSPSDGFALTYQASTKKFNWAAAGGLTNPMTTLGDVIYGGTVTSGVAAPARLALPTTAPALLGAGNATTGVSPAQPEWATAFNETGDIPYSNPTSGGAGWSFLRPGTAAQLLTTHGPGTAPTWADVAKLKFGANTLGFDASGHVAIVGNALTTSNVSTSAAWGTISSLAISGDDTHFSVNFTSGTVTTGSATITISFSLAAPSAAYRVLITPNTASSGPWINTAQNLGNATFTGLKAGVSCSAGTKSTTSLSLVVQGNLLSTTAYGWDVLILS